MRKWLPLVAICAGACMLLVDVTIVNVALPDMARQLHTTFSDLQWVIDLYALVLGALVLTVGSVADRFGRRRLYISGLVLFAAASLACGLAPNVALLIAARGVQGLGAAAMFATTMALISNTYTGRERGMAFGIWGAVNGAASAQLRLAVDLPGQPAGQRRRRRADPAGHHRVQGPERQAR
jgi:MFS family permease